MKIKEAFARSKKYYSAHPLNSWVLGITCAIFLATLYGFDLAIPGLTYIVIPILGIPFFFASILTHFQLKMNNEVRTRNFFRFFAVYFTKPFRSSFRVLISFFKSLVVEAIFTIVLFIIIYLIFTNNYGDAFNNNFVGFFETITDSSLTTIAYNDATQGYLSANNNMLYVFFNLIFIPSSFLSCLSFMYFISLESFSVFVRLNVPQNPPVFIRVALKEAIKKQGKSFYGTYLGLNWPLFLLFIIGFVGGLTISLQFVGDATFASSVGMMSGLGLTSLFAPFYFSNMEAIYSFLDKDVRTISKNLTKQMILDIQAERNLVEKEAEILSKTLDELKDTEDDNPSDIDDNSIEETPDKDKEKDPFDES
jgi:hypothetical protein